LLTEAQRILEHPCPFEHTYLRFIRKHHESWTKYLTEEVLTDPSQFITFELEGRLEIERNFIVWFAEQLRS